MDIASIVGLVGCIGLIIFGIISGEDGVAALANFIHGQSFIITVGGTFASVLTNYTLKDYISSLKSFTLVLKVPVFDEAGVITKIIELSNIARKDGLLALEEAANDLDDAFLKKGILLIVDGTDPELVRAIMETEITCIETRHKKTIGFWENMSTMGPAWGMIGTLIGLINMLKTMSDVTTVGPNMSVALITTLYGSMLANWICIPVAGKLKNNNDSEIMMKEVMIEGLLSIQAGENPRVIEEKLKAFMSPKQRNEMSPEEETVGGGEEANG